MGVDSCRRRGSMPQVALDQAQVHPGFQQVGSIRMSQAMHRGGLVDAAFLPGCGGNSSALAASPDRHQAVEYSVPCPLSPGVCAAPRAGRRSH